MKHSRTFLLSALSSVLFTIAGPLQGQEEAKAAEKKPESIALLKFAGVYADLPEMGGDLTSILLGGGGTPKSFYGTLEKIDDLAESEVERVVLDLSGNFFFNQVQVSELERSIEKLRKSGKTCYAYLENADSLRYQIASTCDEVMLADLGMLDLPAPALSVTFLKDALDLLGVQMDVVRCGDFKGAVEPYLLSSMSKHLRAHYEEMLAKMNSEIVERIAEGRNLSSEKVRALQGERMITAMRAKETDLVDRLVAWNGVRAAMNQVLGHEEFEFDAVLQQRQRRRSMNFMQVFSQLLSPKKEEEIETDTLVVLHLSGAIVDGTKAQPGSIVSGPTVANIRRLAEDENVKGVVLRINSPGGSATASEAILLALKELAEKKPVAVSMGSLAASGGYYITCFGETIFAEEGTITGSIGVFGTKPSIGPLMRRIGVNEELIALDESAAMSSLTEPWSDAAKDRIQGFINQIYDTFLSHVASSRDMSVEEVKAIAGGRVWSGEQALKRGLVDRVGGLGEALELVAKEAKVGEYEVSHQPRPRSFFDSFASELLNVELLLPETAKRLIARKMGLERSLELLLAELSDSRPFRAWAILPETITLR
ncbi:MAG: signal peptide peptidase SppA [Planctomycetota bacterium]|jgi:protease-4